MNKDSHLLPALERPKLILQAFHLCKARTKVEDADTIWDWGEMSNRTETYAKAETLTR